MHTIIISQNNFASFNADDFDDHCWAGITADGDTTNLVTIGNMGSRYGNTGAAFGGDLSKWQDRISIEDGSISGVNIPKVLVKFEGTDTTGSTTIIGGTGANGTGSNYNVDRVERLATTGNYKIYFTNPIPTDNYTIQGTAGGTAAIIYGEDASTSTRSQCKIFAKHIGDHGNTSYTVDPTYISVTIN